MLKVKNVLSIALCVEGWALITGLRLLAIGLHKVLHHPFHIFDQQGFGGIAAERAA